MKAKGVVVLAGGFCCALLILGCMSGGGRPARPLVAVVPSSAAPSCEPEASADALPFKIVQEQGEPADLARAHGIALAPQIKVLQQDYLLKFIPEGFERFLAYTAAEGFRGKLPKDYQQEIAALSESSGTGGRDVMLAQCFLDMTGMVACSTVTLPASASPDGVARFGRNLDFPSLNVIDKYTTLFICRPAGKYAFASVGWPGLIGVLSGMNEHGLTIASMEVTRGRRLPQALPYMLLYRTILEQCRTTDEAIALLEKTPRQTANNLMIMDAAGVRALAEITPEKVTVRRGDDFGLVSTNHHRGKEADDLAGRCARYDSLRLAAVKDHGTIGVPQIEKMLRDASMGDETLQSMIFEPSTRTLYIASGANATTLPFHQVDLRGLLRPTGG